MHANELERHMGLLEQVLGDSKQDHDDYQDFVRRYDQGSPYDNIDDDEAVRRYEQVARNLPPDVYEDSAAEAFARLSPQERREFGRFLQQRARSGNVDLRDLDDDGRDDRFEDPHTLAQLSGRMHRQQPDLLGGMLGGMLGGGGNGTQRRRGNDDDGGMGDMLSNPIAKAALAGITAMAAKKMMCGR